MGLTLWTLCMWVLGGLLMGWIMGGSAKLGGPEDPSHTTNKEN